MSFTMTDKRGEMLGDIDLTVIDVTKDNLFVMWPSLLYSIQSATFIGIDLELSGLGDRKKLNASCLEDRYKSLCSIARTRSVISFGISCFKEIKKELNSQMHIYKVDTYNLFVLCDGEYAVESKSLQFLVNHGFNFNKQYASGIPYAKGNCSGTEAVPSIRQLFKEIILAQRLLIVHNGCIDLIFMYQCFYAELPNTLQTFIADLCELFQAGVIDTKYISEFHSRENLSMLEYLFRKCQHQNQLARKNEQTFIGIESTELENLKGMDKEIIHCSLPTIEATHDIKKYIPMLCATFESKGYCPQQMSCLKIHSVELIIANEQISCEKKSKKRKRKRKQKLHAVDENEQEERFGEQSSKKLRINELNNEDVESNDNADFNNEQQTGNDTTEQTDDLLTKKSSDNILLPRLDGHRAGFDAFMTGYCFAYYKLKLNVDDIVNKIYLTSKDVPLIISKSHFAKTSLQHQKMMMAINGAK